MDRIASPDSDSPGQIHVAGLGLINLFTTDLFGFIDGEIRNSKGKNWLADLQLQNLGVAEVNYLDPSILLKEISQPGSKSLTPAY